MAKQLWNVEITMIFLALKYTDTTLFRSFAPDPGGRAYSCTERARTENEIDNVYSPVSMRTGSNETE